MDQPGKVANPARGQLNRENDIPLSPCVPENLVSRDGFCRPVPRQPAHLHTQAEYDTNNVRDIHVLQYRYFQHAHVWCMTCQGGTRSELL